MDTDNYKLAIKKEYERRYGVKTVYYNPCKPLPKKRLSIEIGDDGTVYEHGQGGISYTKITL